MFGLIGRRRKRSVNKNGEERKVRTDKKREVQPTISIYLKREIERLAYIVDWPVKDVAQALCWRGMGHPDLSHVLGPYAQVGGIHVESSLYLGSKNKPSLAVPTHNHPTERIGIRFPENVYQIVIADLARILDVTPSRATAILLEYAIKHRPTVESIFSHNIERVTSEQMKPEVQKLMIYINRKNPYKSPWNERLLNRIIPKTRETSYKKVTPECIDTETYRWNFD